MFMRDYQDMVFATARRLTASDATAQDITQKKIEIDPQELANFSRRSILGTGMGLGAIAAAELLGGGKSLTKDGGDDAAFNVFTRRRSIIRHFWGGAMNQQSESTAAVSLDFGMQ